MTSSMRDTRWTAVESRLDLRLVPAALTSWAVTAAGILWQVGGSVAALVGGDRAHGRHGVVE